MLLTRRTIAILRGAALFALLSLGGGATLSAVAGGEDEWLAVRASDGAYTAYLPAVPAPFRAVSWTPLGRFVTSGYELKRDSDGCNLTTTSLPAVLRWLGGAEIVYERSRSNFLSENEARQITTAAVLRDDHRGSVLEWANQERHGRAEFFLCADPLHIFNCFADLGTPMELSDGFFQRLSLRPAETPPTPVQ